jgi:hypothetical protein
MSKINDARYRNPLEAPYGQEGALHEKLAVEHFSDSFQDKDSADDGAEIFIIRQCKSRSEQYYAIEVALARLLRAREEDHIIEVEQKFRQEVDALESLRRTNF